MPGWLSSLRDLIMEASPLRRFMLALLVLLPLAALAAAYLWFHPPAYRVLYAQLSDRTGGEGIAALEQLDIPYRLSAADGTIAVPDDQLHAARYSDLDSFNDDLPPLKDFILPGGSEAAARCHMARTVARRAERRTVSLAHNEAVNDATIRYLHRLSDLLFVVARVLARHEGGSEVLWVHGDRRG